MFTLLFDRAMHPRPDTHPHPATHQHLPTHPANGEGNGDDNGDNIDNNDEDRGVVPLFDLDPHPATLKKKQKKKKKKEQILHNQCFI